MRQTFLSPPFICACPPSSFLGCSFDFLSVFLAGLTASVLCLQQTILNRTTTFIYLLHSHILAQLPAVTPNCPHSPYYSAQSAELPLHHPWQSPPPGTFCAFPQTDPTPWKAHSLFHGPIVIRASRANLTLVDNLLVLADYIISPLSKNDDLLESRTMSCLAIVSSMVPVM